AFVRDEKPDHAVEAGGLAGAVRSEKTHHLAGMDLEGDAVDDAAAAKALGEASRDEGGGHRGPPAEGIRGRSSPWARATRTSCESRFTVIRSPASVSPRSKSRGCPVSTSSLARGS